MPLIEVGLFSHCVRTLEAGLTTVTGTGHRKRSSRPERYVIMPRHTQTTESLAKSLSLPPVRVKCSPDDTVGDLKKLIAAQTGTDASKIQLKKWYGSIFWWLCITKQQLNNLSVRYTIYKDHITLADYEIHDGMSLEMY